ncbi:hypothetical protein [Rhizobium phage RHph_X2_26]|nr:hypothetical protein [Rhizobium phage RHph_X2_26]
MTNEKANHVTEIDSMEGAVMILGAKLPGRKLYSVLVAAPTGDVLNVAVWAQTAQAAEARCVRAGCIVLPRERPGQEASAVVGELAA